MSIPKFKNEPLTDFTKPSSRMAMEAALVNVRAKFTREYPIIIGGEEVLTPEKITSYNPSNPSEVVGTFQKADVPLALKAL